MTIKAGAPGSSVLLFCPPRGTACKMPPAPLSREHVRAFPLPADARSLRNSRRKRSCPIPSNGRSRAPRCRATRSIKGLFLLNTTRFQGKAGASLAQAHGGFSGAPLESRGAANPSKTDWQGMWQTMPGAPAPGAKKKPGRAGLSFLHLVPRRGPSLAP